MSAVVIVLAGGVLLAGCADAPTAGAGVTPTVDASPTSAPEPTPTSTPQPEAEAPYEAHEAAIETFRAYLRTQNDILTNYPTDSSAITEFAVGDAARRVEDAARHLVANGLSLRSTAEISPITAAYFISPLTTIAGDIMVEYGIAVVDVCYDSTGDIARDTAGRLVDPPESVVEVQFTARYNPGAERWFISDMHPLQEQEGRCEV